MQQFRGYNELLAAGGLVYSEYLVTPYPSISKKFRKIQVGVDTLIIVLLPMLAYFTLKI